MYKGVISSSVLKAVTKITHVEWMLKSVILLRYLNLFLTLSEKEIHVCHTIQKEWHSYHKNCHFFLVILSIYLSIVSIKKTCFLLFYTKICLDIQEIKIQFIRWNDFYSRMFDLLPATRRWSVIWYKNDMIWKKVAVHFCGLSFFSSKY